MIFLFDFTLFVIDIHHIMLISLFPAPFDHFHFHPTLGLDPALILTLRLIQSDRASIDQVTRGVLYAKFLSIRYVINIDILQDSLIDIDIFQKVLGDI